MRYHVVNIHSGFHDHSLFKSCLHPPEIERWDFCQVELLYETKFNIGSMLLAAGSQTLVANAWELRSISRSLQSVIFFVKSLLQFSTLHPQYAELSSLKPKWDLIANRSNNCMDYYCNTISIIDCLKYKHFTNFSNSFLHLRLLGTMTMTWNGLRQDLHHTKCWWRTSHHPSFCHRSDRWHMGHIQVL